MTPDERARIYDLPCYAALAALMVEELIAEVEAHLQEQA